MKSNPRLAWLLVAAFACGQNASADVAQQPKLVIATMDGKTFDLASHRGHFVIVNFWATWCAPCIKELPDISAFVTAHKNVDAIGIAWEDSDKAEIADFVKKHPVVYPLAQGDLDNPPADFGTPLSLPTTYLIAPDGSVAKTFNGPIETSDLDKAVAAATPKKKLIVVMASVRFIVAGRVQGVFFRASAKREAERLGITGYARNLADGDVEVLALGSSEAIDAFERWLQRGPTGARVDAVTRAAPTEAAGAGFDVR